MLLPLLSETEAETIFAPHQIMISKCHHEALAKFNLTISSYPGTFNKRTKSTMFHNILINEISDAFQKKVDVTVIHKYSSIYVVFSNRAAARFKKLNKKGLPSNHASVRNDAIINQQCCLVFDEFPTMTYIDIGYTLDSTGTEFEILKISCRKNKQEVWSLPLIADSTNEKLFSFGEANVEKQTSENESQKLKLRKKI
jgi:hypothetical protein